MATDPLDMVLRLVAEGRLTADEAAPILAALDNAPASAAPASSKGSAASAAAGAADAEGEPGTGRSLRIDVLEAGRTVVNLRLPLALGRFALDRIPGLSGDQVDRVRAALNSGMTGPVLVVDDDDGGVRIAIE